jgi:heme/copper-type cytochrome/quinol oxidase subunit 1
MPRRYIDYPEAFTYWNEISSIGYLITIAGVVVFLIMLAEMFLVRRKAGANPWGEGATTLEWTLSSPPTPERATWSCLRDSSRSCGSSGGWARTGPSPVPRRRCSPSSWAC